MSTFLMILPIVIYILSCIGWYKIVQRLFFHPKGKWKNLTPTREEFVIMFCPFINTVFCILMTIDLLIDHAFDTKINNNFFSNFFKPRNKK